MTGIDNVRYAEDETCAYCGKVKEGYAVTMDGREVVLCKQDFQRTVKLRTQPEPARPLFDNGR